MLLKKKTHEFFQLSFYTFFIMPQLDKVTFLSQFFWLCFFYLGFYYVILKFYLPKISRILALRRKKMGFSQEGMLSLQQENQQVRENYEVLLSRALVTSKSLFNTFFSRTTNWLNTNATTINKTHFQNVNASYTKAAAAVGLAAGGVIVERGVDNGEKVDSVIGESYKTARDQQHELPDLQVIQEQKGQQISEERDQYLLEMSAASNSKVLGLFGRPRSFSEPAN